MSSFTCEKCQTDIIDTEHGYISGCDHYPLEASNKMRKGLSGLQELFLEKSFTPPNGMEKMCLCYPQPCVKDHQKEVNEAWHKEHGTTPCDECGGIIETHQGNNGFPDLWYCLSCGKEWEGNPFKSLRRLLQDEQDRVLRIVMREYEYHHTLPPDAFNALVKVKLRNE